MELKLTIDRFEGDIAVLISTEKKIINWPKNFLPKETKEGSVISFTLANDANQNKTDKKLAKNILNEILNP